MIGIGLAFAASFIVTWGVVYFSPQFGRFLFDHDLDGVQKFHVAPVPRIGGLGIFIAIVVCAGAAAMVDKGPGDELFWLICCSLPAFGSGFIEDLTKKVSPRVRLLSTMLATLLACFAFHAVVRRLDLPLIDVALSAAPVAFGFTVIAVAGMANSINIIDGFNGLASTVSMMIFASIAFVAYQVGDPLVLMIALTMIGAILGFVIWNFPAGAIFLGDGGAYFIGFMLGESLVLLIVRHPEVSASYAMVALYPLFETLFSIYRRKFVRGTSPGAPDGVHLHTLIYRRVMLIGAGASVQRTRTRRNSMTSPYLWVLNLFAVVPATLFWDDRAWLLASTALFVALYVSLYSSIVKFRTPSWLIARRRPPSLVKRVFQGGPGEESRESTLCDSECVADKR
ncbi:MraY family glycosyltransferase [Paraburkholderia caffeinilytica]|uniref:MraY family glycosyltransferase n=1 Tax=Paraburkholderia caffeinilytica TaxID=1761016 RepID=UPI0038B962AF